MMWNARCLIIQACILRVDLSNTAIRQLHLGRYFRYCPWSESTDLNLKHMK